MNRKEYAKKYWQKKEVKLKKKLEQRDSYYTQKGQDYEHDRRRTAKSRWMRAKCNARTRKKEFTLLLEEYALIIKDPCKYCKNSIAQETGSGLDRIDNDIKLDPAFLDGVFIPCIDEVRGTQPFGICLFGSGGTEHGYLSAKRSGKLYSHMTEPPQAYYANFIMPFADFPVPQW